MTYEYIFEIMKTQSEVHLWRKEIGCKTLLFSEVGKMGCKKLVSNKGSSQVD